MLSVGPDALGIDPLDFSTPGITGVDEAFARAEVADGFVSVDALLLDELVDELLEVLFVLVVLDVEVITGLATAAVLAAAAAIAAFCAAALAAAA